MTSPMFYLCLAVALMLGTYFTYLLVLDRKLRDLRRRLEARAGAAEQG